MTFVTNAPVTAAFSNVCQVDPMKVDMDVDDDVPVREAEEEANEN